MQQVTKGIISPMVFGDPPPNCHMQRDYPAMIYIIRPDFLLAIFRPIEYTNISNMLTTGYMGLPLWMDMSLLACNESEMHIKLKMSIRFRKPKDLLGSFAFISDIYKIAYKN